MVQTGLEPRTLELKFIRSSSTSLDEVSKSMLSIDPDQVRSRKPIDCGVPLIALSLLSWHSWDLGFGGTWWDLVGLGGWRDLGLGTWLASWDCQLP